MTKKLSNKPKQTDALNEDELPHGSLAQLAQPDAEHKSFRFGTQLRNSFLTGLIIVGPIGITVYMVWTFIDFIDSWITPYLLKLFPNIPIPVESIPGIGLVVSIFGIMVIGAFTANLFGRTFVSYGERVLDRMPVVRNLYRALKQIFETVLSQSGNSFQNVGMIEYPRPGLYAIVFISTETHGEVAERCADGKKFMSVFLPTTPNPTSGYLLFLPEEDIIILDMSVEEGAKLVISAGLVVPPQHKKQDANVIEPKVESAAKAENVAEPKSETVTKKS